MRRPPLLRLGLPLLLAPALACASGPAASPPSAASVRVEHWGGMREVLRDGRTEGRVVLADVLGPDVIAVGALEGLAGEVTVDGRVAHVAQVLDAGARDGLRVRAPRDGERAALLVLARVDAWSGSVLPSIDDVGALERAVRERAAAAGLDTTRPLPFRVEGRTDAVRLHVIDRSCPIAHPDGPPPWRLATRDVDVVLVGFHAEGAGGVLTHHGSSSHVHALLADGSVSGHLDELALPAGARLFLPAR